MKIFNRELGGGKTTALLELMDRPENSSVIYVAPTRQQADMARSMFETMTGKKSDPARFVKVSQVNSLLDPESHYPPLRFVIDEVEGVLNSLIGGQVLAVAGTDEDLRTGQIQRMSEGR